uniref:LacI family transcriptional regulator n=1 Tax=Thermosporothrix sp. COM3 TaxID=2490863 RepID=A0A455SK34_9CHLR|nr:LacI family transcriptional regulator [Thermosporothrix sp. COM3]
MPTTLKDVALRAGVSIKTVSNVIHGNIHVKEEKRQRVLQALKELNYQPNLPARYLRKGRVGILSLVIPELRNPYFAEIAEAVIDAAAEQSYRVMLDFTSGTYEHERQAIEKLHSNLIDGIILNSLMLKAEDLHIQGNEKLPIVLLGEHSLDMEYDHVTFDNVAAAYAATTHLLQLGRRQIAVIGFSRQMQRETTLLRFRGYAQALADAGLSLQESLLVYTPTAYDRESGAQAVHTLLERQQPFDALFCFNDLMAFGAMRALYERGLHVPEDIAVVGFDNLEEARFSVPSLTTVAPDKRQIGTTAVTRLLQCINGPETHVPGTVTVPFRLTMRESTGFTPQ